MTTADDFTEAARAEAEKTWPKQRRGVHVNPSLIRDEMVRMAVWARAHLAAQEPTDAEVEAAKAVLDSVEYADEPQSIRAALSAARAARRDEEKRDG